jgi:hypothetical protein
MLFYRFIEKSRTTCLLRRKQEGFRCLIVARAKVAPTKPISIPRLELQAAVMGSRLARSIKQELEIKIDQTFLWTDSTTVLHWIRSNGKKVGQFELHRIGEIQELTNTED